jgi:capsular polysaccharide export protein
MAGKQVHCFGAPFYAGRGLTIDHVTAPYRYQDRSIEDLFYYAYITLSRYYDPAREKIVEVEDIVDHIVRERSWAHEI